MFELAFSFWNRLVGKSSPTSSSEAAIAVADDWRLWVRYATDLQGKIQRADKQHGQKMLADVRDLAVGGVNLIVDKRFETGQMLSLELPANKGEIRSVLACIARVTSTVDDKWSLGCVFLRELDSEDLGVQKVAATESDQRIWMRFTCDVRASYRNLGDPPSKSRPVKVLNISASGIGLLLEPSLDAGRLLNVNLFGKTGRKVCAILARVVHTTVRSDGDTLAGCNFIHELTDEELESLLECQEPAALARE